jgi:hypothetical protein
MKFKILLIAIFLPAAQAFAALDPMFEVSADDGTGPEAQGTSVSERCPYCNERALMLHNDTTGVRVEATLRDDVPVLRGRQSNETN